MTTEPKPKAERKMQKLSWQEWDGAVRMVAANVINHPHRNKSFPKQVIGISRGGAVLASQLSHLLDIPYAHTIHAQAYAKDTTGFFQVGAEIRQNKVTFFSAPQLSPQEVMTSLFCDDIVDSGLTIEDISSKYGDARFVCAVGRVEGINKAGKKLYINPPITIWDERWIEFPWESTTPTNNKPLSEISND